MGGDDKIVLAISVNVKQRGLQKRAVFQQTLMSRLMSTRHTHLIALSSVM